MNNSADKSKAKLEAALRANLGRRKQQARARTKDDAPAQSEKPAKDKPDNKPDNKDQ